MNLGFKSLASKSKKLRYGGYSAVLTVIVAAALVLVVILSELLNVTVDLTPNKIYTPGELSMTILDGVEDDIAIYGCFTTGSENYNTYKPVVELAEQYTRFCGKITYQTVDTLKHPEFIKPYINEDDLSAGVEDGTFMVVNTRTGKYRMLTLYSFYGYLDATSEDIDAFTAEEAFTSAIQYVTAEHTPIVYELEGHQETVVNTTLTSFLRTTNADFEGLNLMTYGKSQIPVDGYSMVMINTPMTDLIESEYNLLLDYLERGGRMIFLVGVETPANLPYFNKLLARFGISYTANLQTFCIGERSSANMVSNNPYCMIPVVNYESDALKSLKGTSYYYTVPYAVPILMGESASGKTQFQSLLETSSTSVMVDLSTGQLVRGSDGNYMEGPFTVGLLATEEKQLGEQAVTTKLAVFGTRHFIEDKLLESSQSTFITTGNYRLLANVIGYMQDDIDDLYISGKSLSVSSIQTSDANFIAGLTVFGIVIPLVLIVAGVVIFVRRKRL